MAFNQQNRTENENLKFVDDGSGNPAVRIKMEGGVTISEGSTFEIKDHRGFVVFSVDGNGNVCLKGAMKKL